MVRLWTQPNKLGMMVIIVFLSLLALPAVVWPIEPAEAPPARVIKSDKYSTDPQTEWVQTYIEKFSESFKNSRAGRKVIKRAPELSKLIVEQANRFGVDPKLLTVVVRCESSFREGMLKGKINNVGELGLAQVHGTAKNKAKKQGCDINTSEGQLCAGAYWLSVGLERCKTTEGALHFYQAGKCHSKAYGPVYRMRLLKKAGVV